MDAAWVEWLVRVLFFVAGMAVAFGIDRTVLRPTAIQIVSRHRRG